MTTVEIEAKLLDFTQLLREWVDRYEQLGVPRHKVLAQMRTVLINLQMEIGIDHERTITEAIEEERKRCLSMIERCRAVYERYWRGATERDRGNNPDFYPTVNAHDSQQKMRAMEYAAFVVGDWSVGDKFKKCRSRFETS
jgi:hypothetical protein